MQRGMQPVARDACLSLRALRAAASFSRSAWGGHCGQDVIRSNGTITLGNMSAGFDDSRRMGFWFHKQPADGARPVPAPTLRDSLVLPCPRCQPCGAIFPSARSQRDLAP